MGEDINHIRADIEVLNALQPGDLSTVEPWEMVAEAEQITREAAQGGTSPKLALGQRAALILIRVLTPDFPKPTLSDLNPRLGIKRRN